MVSHRRRLAHAVGFLAACFIVPRPARDRLRPAARFLFIWRLRGFLRPVVNLFRTSRRTKSGERRPAFSDVTLHRFRFYLCKHPQRPRQCLHHHRIAVAFEHAANLKRAANVAPRRPRLAVQRNGRHQCGASPPPIVRARPFVNHAVRHLALIPDGPGEIRCRTHPSDPKY